MKKCSECGSDDLRYEHHNDMIICRKCGEEFNANRRLR
jgi:transcription initiation factor TFIIIB Brf1 subunit/transcription initiation factor TFIIB